MFRPLPSPRGLSQAGLNNPRLHSSKRSSHDCSRNQKKRGKWASSTGKRKPLPLSYRASSPLLPHSVVVIFSLLQLRGSAPISAATSAPWRISSCTCKMRKESLWSCHSIQEFLTRSLMLWHGFGNWLLRTGATGQKRSFIF